MFHSPRYLLGTGRDIVGLARESRLSFLAASTAFYAFVSTFPLLLLLIAAGTFVGGDTLAERVLDLVGGVLSPTGQGLVRDAIRSATGRATGTFVGIIGLSWSSLRVFRGLDLAFGTVYGSAGSHTILGQIRNAVLALGALVVGVAAVLAGHLLLTWAGVRPFAIPYLGIFVSVTVVLTPLYAVFPNVRMSLREALAGAVTAALGWTVLSVLFRIYAANAGQFDVYGVIGGALLFVTWLYFGAQILLLGAVVNAVLADRDRQLQLDPPPRSGRDPTMTGTDGTDEEPAGKATPGESNGARGETDAATSKADRRDEIAELRAEIERLEADIDDRTVHREAIESDLRQYVRRRLRRGHASGWGPYLVLLYGTVMTLGAFYFLAGGWAVLAMLVIWLSTLGLYVLMVLVGVTVSVVGVPGRVLDRVRDWRR